MDSFESLGEAEATVDFLRGLPCNVLITSRVRRSEFHDPFIVDSLPGNPAKELFAALTQESLLEDPETDALCLQDLGGHPLAIEVIAAWARFGMTPQELRQSLREAPGIVLGEDQEADELGGVAKALYLSYSQLEPSAQNVLSCASVFRTQFDIAALSALLPGQTRLQLAKAMRQLQEHSLLQVVGYNSYRLHAVTGQYAYGKLADKPAAHRRAAAYYLSEQGDDSLAAVEQLVRAGERDEAAGLVPQHVEAWIHAGRASEALVILDEFDLVQVSPTHQATICEAKGDLLYLLGELDEAIVQFERAVESAALAKGGTRARLHRKLAEVLSRKGEHEQALNRLLQGRALLAEGEDLREEGARLAASYGTVLLALGRYDEAIEEAQKAIYRLHNLAAFPRTAADLYDLMGKAYAFTGDLAASLERFQSALELREACSDLRGVVRSHSNLAFVYGEQNLYDEAIQANQTAIDLAESLDDKIALSTLYMNMAADCMDRGDFDQASDLNMQALSLAEQMGYVYQLSILHHNLGELHRHTERLDLSVEHFEQAIELANQVDYQSGVIGGMAGLAEVYLAQGRIQEALSQCMESLRLAEHLANQYWRPASLYLLGRIHYAMRHWDRARSAFSEARQLWRERGACIDLYDLLQSWAQLEKDAGQIGRARELGKEAAAMADRLDASD